MKAIPLGPSRLFVFINALVLLLLVCVEQSTTVLSYFYCCFREQHWLESTNEVQLDRRVGAFYTSIRFRLPSPCGGTATP